MKHAQNLTKWLAIALALALFTVALPLAASAQGDLKATVRDYLIGSNSGASAASAFADGTKRNVGAEQVNSAYDQYTFLDIRLDEQYNAGHIKGAYHIPYGEAIAEQFKYIPLDKDIVVVSNDGQLSWQLTGALNAILADEGITTKVISWQGGYTTEGIDADKISTDAVALPAQQNALSEAGNQLLTEYFGNLANAQWDHFIVDEATTWEIIQGIRKGDKDYTDHYAVALLPAFGGTYVGQFNDSIFRSDYGGESGADTLLNIPQDKTVLVACGSGQTSDNIVGALRVLGYDAYSVRNGWGGNKGELTGETKNGGVNAYDASQVAAGKKALFSENVTGLGISVQLIILIAAAVVVVIAAVVFLVVRSKKKAAKKGA